MIDTRPPRAAPDISVFPLSLSPFERYMRADDRPSLPMAFTIRLVFSGAFRPEFFRRALQAAVDREPLFRANIRGSTPRDLCWVAAPDEPPHCDIGPADAAMDFPGTASIDLTKHAGLRTWVRYDDRRAEMRFQFHHCSSDGVAAYRFLDDLLRIYDRLARPESLAAPNSVEVSRLRSRTHLGMSRVRRLLMLPLHWLGTLGGSLLYYFRCPKPFPSPERPVVDDADLRRLPDHPVRRLSSVEFTGLKAAAKSAGVSLNDLLTADLFLALREWQERVSGEKYWGRIRVMVPVNARTASDDRMPATNIVAMIPISRDHKLLDRPERLVPNISRYLRLMRKFGAVVWFLRGLRMFEMLGGFRLVLSERFCGGTSCLSNVGKVFDDSTLPRRDGKLISGDLCLEEVESTPPVRPLTPVSLTVLTYAGTLSIALNYDRQVLTRTAAEEFLTLYVGRLLARASAGAPGLR